MSLIELALVCPIILLIIAGIVDFGSTLREIQQINTAAREGARIAASFSRRTVLATGSVACRPAIGVPLTPCNSPASSLELVQTDSVQNAARKAACAALQNAYMDPNLWEVNSEVQTGVENFGAEDEDRYDTVRVNIARAAGASDCVICWGRFFENMRPNVTSSFALEEPCS